MADLAVVALGIDTTGAKKGGDDFDRITQKMLNDMASLEARTKALQDELKRGGDAIGASFKATGASASQMGAALSGLGGPVGELSGKIGNLTGQMSGLVESFGVLGGAALGAVAGVAALGAALVKLTLDGVKMSDQMGDIAESTGLTIDQVQRFAAAATLAGEDIGFVERSFRTFQGIVQSAIDEPTGKAALTLKRLGIDAKEAGKDMAEAYLNAVANLKDLRSTTEGAVATNEAFGRGIGALSRIADTLKEILKGSREELERHNTVAGKDAVEAGQRLDQQMNELNNSWSVFKQNLANTSVGSTLENFFKSLNEELKRSRSNLDLLTLAFKLSPIGGGISQLAIPKTERSTFFDVQSDPFGSTNEGGIIGGTAGTRAGVPAGGGKGKGGTGGGSARTIIDQAAKQLASDIAAQEKENAAFRKTANDALIKDMEKLSDEINTFVHEMLNLPTLKDTSGLGLILRGGTPPISGGGIPGSPNVGTLAPSQIRSAQKARLDEEFGFIFEDFIKIVISGRATVKEAFAGFLTGILDVFAQEFSRAIEQEFIRPVVKAMSDILSNALNEIFGNVSAKGVGGFFQSVFKGIGKFFGGLFAEGGTLPANHWGIAGERGPEIIYSGSRPMQITPMGGGGGGAVTLNFAISAPSGSVDRRTQDQIADAAMRGLERAQKLRGAR